MQDRNHTETKPLDEHTPELSRTPEEYEAHIGRDRVEELRRRAAPLAGKRWANINSTFVGGGVAEMLRSLIPLARALGVDANWYCIRGDEEFFRVTKKFHNMLQGMDLPITEEEMYGTYLDTIDANSGAACTEADLVVVHDPQPAALVSHMGSSNKLFWRCHIDTSTPNPTVWQFLLPYINRYAGAIFTMTNFVGPGVRVPSHTIFPCIDPCAEKNRQYTDSEAQQILAPLFEEHDVDPGRPILAAISRYDVHKNQATILKAYRALCAQRHWEPRPYLIFMGNTATDDPEGAGVLAQLREEAGDHPDVRFWVNVGDNDRVVGALMRVARAFTHVSTREGFGLVVSEALWQGTPVIGSRVGGITKQVPDGQTGFLVEPTDVDAIAARMAWVLDHPAEARALGAAGKEHVR